MLVALAALTLAGCATPNKSGPDNTAAEVVAAAYRDPGPAKLTLLTMVNNRNGSGAHTALIINASQRVIFDPAGTLNQDHMPEIGDVLYGATPQLADFYIRAHARSTFHVRLQEVVVPDAVAERALQLVQQSGHVPSALCTSRTSEIMRQLPGFESLSSTWFPNNLADDMARIPGVTETQVFDDDGDDKADAVRAFNAAQAQAQANP